MNGMTDFGFVGIYAVVKVITKAVANSINQ